MANRKSQRRAPASASPKVVLSTPAPAQPQYDRNFNPDYSQVITDLKRIGTLAGIFLGVLIVLSFFL
ncbi:MAG: hypothetical protein OHK0052_27200 [Anaerolineales bacterium]